MTNFFPPWMRYFIDAKEDQGLGHPPSQLTKHELEDWRWEGSPWASQLACFDNNGKVTNKRTRQLVYISNDRRDSPMSFD